MLLKFYKANLLHSPLLYDKIHTLCNIMLGGGNMANLCEVCGKSTASGMSVSHSHIRTKRTWKPNIQRVRAIVDGETKKVNVCTRCLRSNKITRA